MRRARAPFSSSWSDLGSILDAFEQIWSVLKNIGKPSDFKGFFKVLVGPGEHYECNFACYGDMLGHLSNITRQVGDKMGANSVHVSQSGDQDHQDEPA